MGATRAQAVVLYVIDDDASVRDALCRLAVSAGFEATAFDSIREFAAQAGVRRAGCVLLDSSQVGIGPRASQPPFGWNGALPVIVLGASPDDEGRRNARSSGAQFFLNKPVDARALFDAIAWVTESAG